MHKEVTMRAIGLTLLALVIATFLGTGAKAETRVALVIGNSSYSEISALSNPKNDAAVMTKTLKAVGFEVVVLIDGDRRAMGRAVRTFGHKLRRAGKDAVGLFYYAGHGIQARGDNYLIPIGALVDDHADLRIEALSASDILEQMESAGNRLNLVILDACRNNPFKGKIRSSNRGLARIQAASGTLVAFSAAPGQVATDGEGKNSPYTSALIQAMQKPGLTVEHVFKQVRVEVERKTGGQQTPWEESSLLGDFYFTPAKLATAAPAKPFNPPATAQSADRAAWAVIQETNSKAVLQAFINEFPDSLYTTFARARLTELEAQSSVKTNGEVVSETTSTKQGEPEDQPAHDQLASIAADSEAQAEHDPDLPRKLQIALRDAGCNPGKIDGQWGSNSTAALERFVRYAKLSLPEEAVNEETLKLFEGRDGRTCPLVCGAQQVEKNGLCVAKSCPKGQRLIASGTCVRVQVRQRVQKARPQPQPKAPKRKKQTEVGLDICTLESQC